MRFWPSQCRPGDMIRVRIGSIWHYGIYVSDSEVIQFGFPPREGAERADIITVCATDMDAFSGGSIVERAELGPIERLKRFPPDKTVALARSRLGEGGYDLLHNNCEHFVFECVFGVKRSMQEEEARKRWNDYVKSRQEGGEEDRPPRA